MMSYLNLDKYPILIVKQLWASKYYLGKFISNVLPHEIALINRKDKNNDFCFYLSNDNYIFIYN